MTTIAPLLGAAELARLAKALGHPARGRILELLLAQATVSQHLKVMKRAGLVRGEVEGPRVSYCADRERLAELHGLIGGLLEGASDLAVGGRGCD